MNFIGCATVPLQEGLATYNINGITYLPLVSLCQFEGISWEYDTVSRTAALNKGQHTINLRVGDALILVDSQPRYLKHPVDFYQGMVVVPRRFKDEILDVLFKKEAIPAKRPARSAIKKIVIDAGHGGTDPGAISRSGLKEKNVTLDIAKRLARLLKDEGIEVVLSRPTDVFVSLSRRAEIANRSQADLFISIHANANRVRTLNGFEIYYISGRINDAQRALATAEILMPNLGSNCFAYPGLDLKAIVWDMIYTSNRASSIELANAICRTVDRNLNTRVLGVKGANFQVLRGARMPAILVETGFLSNYGEERRLRNSYYRQQIAEAIKVGIDNYAREYIFAEATSP